MQTPEIDVEGLIVHQLRLDSLAQTQRELIIEKAKELLQKKVILRILPTLQGDQRSEAMKIIHEREAVFAYLAGIQDISSIVSEELATVSAALKEAELIQ